eukprot:Clim_evm3s175 gene=Clim_evmTU3s175
MLRVASMTGLRQASRAATPMARRWASTSASSAESSSSNMMRAGLMGFGMIAAAGAYFAARSQYQPASLAKGSPTERTFIMIKPDGVHRGLIGEIIGRFEKKGYKLVAMKVKHADLDLLRNHYADLAKKPFFPGLIKYMNSGPVCCMVWEGPDAVRTGRVMLGATNPQDSLPGTIRGDLCLVVGRNVCHGSDSVESANKEIGLWFNKSELVDWERVDKKWVIEDN